MPVIPALGKQGQPLTHNKFEASLGYMKKTKQTNKELKESLLFEEDISMFGFPHSPGFLKV